MTTVRQEPARFWFVWTKTGHVPRQSHNTQTQAEAEAKRLAIKYPGKKFITLKAEQKFSSRVEDPPCGDEHVTDHRAAFEREAV